METKKKLKLKITAQRVKCTANYVMQMVYLGVAAATTTVNDVALGSDID